ncbi:Predicted GTPase-activating protein [Ceraceosorus bombacis]|uniref:Predicted GTPase-activating protein n=1 Tax=Ceraceosorus bombacis TaxID=401625 RepID=A0A0P1BEZ0_9BASI|nr:Predicted GTPase-activating protein [Ceraceosorus bombacis]
MGQHAALSLTSQLEAAPNGNSMAASTVPQDLAQPDQGSWEQPSSISRVRVRRVLRLRPTPIQPASQISQPRSLRTSIQSRLEYSDDPVQGLGAGQHSGLWARLGAPPCEFVMDEEPGASEDADAEEDQVDPAHDSLFRLQRPREAAHKRWYDADKDQRDVCSLVENHTVNLKVRLRFQSAHSAATSSNSTSSAENGSRRRTPSSSSRPNSAHSHALYFVSAESSSQLLRVLNAADNKLQSRPGGLTRPGWTVVPQDEFQQERDQDFDVEWTPEQFGKTGKRACCFVEVNERNSSSRILAGFAFYVDPLVPATSGIAPTPSRSAATSPASASRSLPHDSDDRRLTICKPESDPVPFPSSDPAPSGATSKALMVDHTEITVADCLEADSPLFRAAVQNLSRRTAALKKQAKAVLRATADVQAHASASRAAHGALDDALQDLSISQPNTLGKLLQLALTQARTRARAQDESESSMLDNCVTGPVRNLLELCRTAQEHIKLFEADSRAYYNHTQKWLSTKTISAGAMSADVDADVSYASNAVGYDKGQAKQDKKDELQRLRQLKFDRARVELYRVHAALHGGAAELESAQQILFLCRWHADTAPTSTTQTHWPAPALYSALEKFGDEALAAAQQAKAKDVEARKALDVLDAQIIELDETFAGATQAPGDATDPSTTLSSVENSKNAASAKFKSLLSSFGAIGSTGLNAGSAGRNAAPADQEHVEAIVDTPIVTQTSDTGTSLSSTTAQPPAPGPASASTSATNAIGLMRQKVSQRFVNAGPATTAITGPVMGAFQRFRGTASGTANVDEHLTSPQELSMSLPSATPKHYSTSGATTAPAAPSVTAVSPFAVDASPIGLGTPRGVNRNTPRRALSQSNTPSPFASKQGLLDFRQRLVSATSPGQNASVRTTQRGSPSMNRSSSESTHTGRGLGTLAGAGRSTSSSSGLGIGGLVMEDQDVRQMSMSSLISAAPRFGPSDGLLAQSSRRKKEGLLWVHSRPINSTSASDAPRGVNRSTHWREAWVVLSGSGHLGEYAAWREKKVLEPSQPMIDLRFATVREARGVERRFTFEVITRDQRRFFQAPDDAAMKSWIAAIRIAIESLINGTSSVRQIDKVARSAEITEALESVSGPDDFGLAALRPLGPPDTGNALASQSKAFSQSLTDLSNIATNRLFNRQSDSLQRQMAPASSSRHSLVSPQSPSSPYLSVLMEGSRSGMPTTPTRPSHERGISNKTPVSGYVGTHDAGVENITITSPLQTAAAAASRQPLLRRQPTDSSDAGVPPWMADNEFDARIAELVQGSYGDSTTDLSTIQVGPAPMMAGSSTSSGASASTSTSQARRMSQVSNHRRASTELQSPSKRLYRPHLSTDMSGAKLPSSSAQEAAATTTGNVRKRVERINSGQSQSKVSRAAEIARISRLPENSACADCRLPDPRWASWALNGQPCCIFICISCSGVHRSLGVHVSKVKSVDLDDWTEEQLDAAREWGNARANSYYEASRPASVVNPLSTTARADKTFWKEKYVEKRWAALGPREQFLRASSSSEGSDPNAASPSREIRSPKRTSTSYPIRSSSHVQTLSYTSGLPPSDDRSAFSQDSPLNSNGMTGIQLASTPRPSIPSRSPTVQRGIANHSVGNQPSAHSITASPKRLERTAAITAAGWSFTPETTPSRDLSNGTNKSTALAHMDAAPETPTRSHSRSQSSSHRSPQTPLALAR